MRYQKFFYFLQNVGKDPSALIFEDELTRLGNRRYLLNYLRHEIDWDSLDSHPLSMLMIDIDYFKRLNDEYGYEAGDQALVHISSILRETLPPQGLAVRYAGDEFIVVLPGSGKENARNLAAHLMDKIHYNLFFSAVADTAIPITLSIGFATAPEDAATEKDLIHKADTALYYAKQSGRNRHVDAASVVAEEVSSKTAIHYLDNAGIVGRKSQFETVGRALKNFGSGQSQFLVIRGAPGMGKTSFLNLVQRNLDKKSINLIRVAGVLQESYRPYYLISYITMALMRQRKDNGREVLDSLDQNTLNRLAHVMPQLIGAEEPRPEDDPAQREAVFNSFVNFFSALLERRRMIMLIDDLDYSDPASLYMMHALFKKQTPLLVCGTASEERISRPRTVPLELFQNAYGEDLGIQEISLTALTGEDIAKHVSMIFPGIQMPKKTARELSQTTEGNPLFIAEVLRKMVTDGKIFQEKHKWRIGRIERAYFPKSLEEIIHQKTEMLDEESRYFINQASVFGEQTSLSMLAGFSKYRTAKIYDCLDEAANHGIVRSELEDVDENVFFSSKRVRDTIYDKIPPEMKEKLQEKIGSYKEELYYRGLLPSTSIAAYHFSQSSNPTKAELYTQLHREYYQKLFNIEEASSYTPEPHPEENSDAKGDAVADTPLSSNAMSRVPGLLRALIVAIRNTRLYPSNSRSVTESLTQLTDRITEVLKTDKRISIINEKKELLINQAPLSLEGAPKVKEKILELFEQLEIKHLTFVRGLQSREIHDLVKTISRTPVRAVKPGFWKKLQKRSSMPHIIVGQVRYEKIIQEDEAQQEAAGREKEESTQPPEPGMEDWPYMDDSDLGSSRQAAGSLLAAANRLKLYPSDSPVAAGAVKQLHSDLQAVFARHQGLTISRVDKTLLANGVKLDSTGFETLAEGLIKFFADAGIESMTVLSPVTTEELAGFISSAASAASEKDPSYLSTAAASEEHNNILINAGIYGIKEVVPGDAAEKTKDKDQEPGENRDLETEAGARGPGGGRTEMDELPARIRDLFLTGNYEKAREILGRVSKKYRGSDSEEKRLILNVFRAILEPADWKPSAEFIQFIMGPLIELFKEETEPEPLNQAAEIGYEASESLILFGEYSLGAWIIAGIENHPYRSLIHGHQMPAHVCDALVQGLCSKDRKLQQAAFQLISSIGKSMLPHLLSLIKQDIDPATRRMAAKLIKHQGAEGEAAVKRSLIGEHIPEDRARILDVIDAATDDIKMELSFALADSNETVRRAGARLAERLNSPEAAAVLKDLAQRRDTDTAITAINLLGRLRAVDSAEILIQLLDQSEDEETLIAVCRAMGQIGDASFILPLQNLLRPRRSMFLRKTRSSRVRVAAAYAVKQIDDPRSGKILNALSEDADPRVREAARNLAV